MNKTEERKIEKALIDKINKELDKPLLKRASDIEKDK